MAINNKNMDIGQSLKQIRIKQGLRQTAVAQKAKVTQTYLSQIENGVKDNPSKDFIERLAKVYKVPVSVIFFLAMEERDVRKDRVQQYRKVRPAMESLIFEIIK